VAGDDPGIGVFFVPIEDPAKAVKATRIAKNLPSEIIGIVPPTIEYLVYQKYALSFLEWLINC